MAKWKDNMNNPPIDVGFSSECSLLWRTCIMLLKRFYLPEVGILARSLVWDGATWKITEPSPRNTAIALVALYQLRHCGFALPLDTDTLIERLITKYIQVEATHVSPQLDYSDVALTLWADATGDNRYLSLLWKVLERRIPGDATQTMELAWALSALCHYFSVAENPGSVKKLAQHLYRRIVANQSPVTRMFHGSAQREGWFRRRVPVATLSSQTYPIQALTFYGQIFHVPEALERAQRCADTLCRLQGPQGQWWWRYNVREGSVVEKYPVYAVNQDGAIPMALGELQRAFKDRRYETAITCGVAWLFGDNELQTSLVDEESSVIWRAIEQANGELTIVHEMYSYHPARCLYGLCRYNKGSCGN